MDFTSNYVKSSSSESAAHKIIKKMLLSSLSKNNHFIRRIIAEKYIDNRRADILLEMTDGKEIAIEIQNSYLTVKELKKRCADYSINNVHVLWILYANGKCVGTPKVRIPQRNVKVSTTEHFLHRLYQGRVYYVALHRKEKNLTVTPPFALHQLSPRKRKYHGLFKQEYTYFYYRDTSIVSIPNWNFLYTTSNGFKIALFCDPPYFSYLRNSVIEFLRETQKHIRITDIQLYQKVFSSSRRLRRFVYDHFKINHVQHHLKAYLKKFDWAPFLFSQ